MTYSLFTSFIKKYFWHIAAIIAIFIIISLGNSDNRLIQSILKKSERANERHDKLTKDISELKTIEREEKKQSEIEYQNQIKDIQNTKTEKLNILDEQTKKKVQDKLKQGPLSDEELEKLANKFRDRHGFK